MICTIRIALWVMLTTIVFAAASYVTRTAIDGQAKQRQAETDETQLSTTIPASQESEDRIHRVALKQEAISDMLDGRLTLAETASRFWDVSVDDESAMNNLRHTMPGRTDDELIVHQVLTYARVQTNSNPKRFAARLAHIEIEARSFRLQSFVSH